MKQHISYKQWMELDDQKREKYLAIQQNRATDKIGQPNAMPYASIGQMIEFLGDDLNSLCFDGKKSRRLRWNVFLAYEEENLYSQTELCDVLWEA